MAVDFSFPEWMVRQHTFAGALARGAQVGQAIANARYRNQALAVQAEQANKEYALREKQLASQQRTSDLNFNLQSQLVEDQSEDKAAITGWIQERNKLPMEERLSMELPELRLAQSYEILNKIADNDRMTYERSILGQSAAARAKILGAVPELAEDYFNASDPNEKREILKQAREQYVKQQPASIAAENRMEVAKFRASTQEKLVGIRGDINLMRDQLKIDATSDLEDQRQLGRLELLERRYANLTALQEDSQEFKAELSKLQNDLAMTRDVSKAGLQSEAAKAKQYGVTEESFISRNLKTIFEDLSSTKEHKNKSVEARTQEAANILRKAYQSSPISKPNPVTTAPSSKADLANKLAAEHPDWDRARIILEVNKQLP